jgi:hypothetical protein
MESKYPFNEDEFFFMKKCIRICESATQGFLLHILLPMKRDPQGWILTSSTEIYLNKFNKRKVLKAEREMEDKNFLEIIKIQEVLQYRINQKLICDLYSKLKSKFIELEYPPTKFDIFLETDSLIDVELPHRSTLKGPQR